MKKRIIINATAGKVGGTKTIVDSFLLWIAANDTQSEFLLLAPNCPRDIPKNVTYIKKSTSGINTLWFSCLAVSLRVFLFRATHIICFNNINLLLPLCKRITYFHQAKLFTEKSLRFRAMAFVIRCLRGSTYIFQTPLLKDCFVNMFGERYVLQLKWAGITPENVQKLEQPQRIKEQEGITLLWPVTNPFAKQKNLDWFYKNKAWLEENSIKLLVTSQEELDLPGACSIGLLDRKSLFELYQKVNAVIIVSTEESFCLPIFEAASLGTSVLVLKMPHIEAIHNWRPLPEHIQVFSDTSEINLAELHPGQPADASYYTPDWNIY
jgi:glycosyltransferase involved in cell wall biosynthesis